MKPETQEKLKTINSNNLLEAIKSKYILLKIFDYLQKGKSLKLIKYNKNIQKKIEININDYIKFYEIYSPIEIHIIPIKNKSGKFINIEEKNKKYYHIYFNNNTKEEIKRTYLNKNEKVLKIRIIIDYQVKSFHGLFWGCRCIESIYFKTFYRNNIINMSRMFCECKSLKKINFKNFNSNNVTDMSFMFNLCKSLKKLNLNCFNTSKVTNMFGMFRGCKSLKEINLNSFNTSRVKDMRNMFSRCESLKELNLNHFNTNRIDDISGMFYGCWSLKELNINSFNPNVVTVMEGTFYDCSHNLKIISQFSKFKDKAFEEDNYEYYNFYYV